MKVPQYPFFSFDCDTLPPSIYFWWWFRDLLNLRIPWWRYHSNSVTNRPSSNCFPLINLMKIIWLIQKNSNPRKTSIISLFLPSSPLPSKRAWILDVSPSQFYHVNRFKDRYSNTWNNPNYTWNRKYITTSEQYCSADMGRIGKRLKKLL